MDVLGTLGEHWGGVMYLTKVNFIYLYWRNGRIREVLRNMGPRCIVLQCSTLSLQSFTECIGPHFPTAPSCLYETRI